MISDDHDDARQAMQVIVMGVANIKKMLALAGVNDLGLSVETVERNIERLDRALGRMGKTEATVERLVASIEQSVHDPALEVALWNRGLLDMRFASPLWLQVSGLLAARRAREPRKTWCAAATGCAVDASRSARAGCPFFENGSCHEHEPEDER